MKVVKTTPFSVASVAGRVRYPAHSLTLVVKATYDITADGLEPADPQAFPDADVYYDDDEEQTGSIRYAADLVHFKPRADLLLVGKCFAPGGRPVARCPVTFRVGSHSRTLMVTGNRVWKAGLLSTKMSDPEPFTTMDLRYERSFGGPRIAENPVGCGHKPEQSDDEAHAGKWVRRLPNIEDPAHLIVAPGDKPSPAGFGPIASTWHHRSSKLGTYKGNYESTRWPWFPEDFDFGHFNAAPAAMQYDGFLRGDEELECENLLPDQAKLRTTLPGLRIRGFLHELPQGVTPQPRTRAARRNWTPPSPQSTIFREVDLKLDTLWVDTEAMRVVLVWRGVADVRSDEHEEIQHAYLAVESLADEPRSIDNHRANFIRALAVVDPKWFAAAGKHNDAAEEEDDGEQGSPAAETHEEAADPDDDATLIVEPVEEDELDVEMAKLRKQFEEAGIDPDNPPEVTPEERAAAAVMWREQGHHELADLIEQANEEEVAASSGADSDADDEASEPWTREQVQRSAAEGESMAGENLSKLDLSNLDLTDVDLSGADLSGAMLQGATLAGADLTAAVLADSDLTDAALIGAMCDGAVLSGATCIGADFTDAQLAGADLTDANFSQATLDGVDATGATCLRVRLHGASLVKAVLDQANLTEAIIASATATKASFIDAQMDDVQAQQACFDTADLTGASLQRADLRKASMIDATVEGALLCEARLLGADLTRLRASDGCDITGADLRAVTAVESIWDSATADRVDLSFATLCGADFTNASMVGANLHACDLREARLTGAVLHEATITEANLFEALIKQADLTRADLSGSNLYGAELLDVVFQETKADRANFAMTKLA